MLKEIVLKKNYISENIETIYFGGGTPSVLPKENLEILLNEIHKNFVVSSNAEVTLEINPDDISSASIGFWKSSGINRFSVGVQTFNDKILKYLNRLHNAKQAQEGIKLLQEKGFQNISVDLIYAIAASNDEILKTDLSIIETLCPAHVSAYNLTIEEKTVFGNWHRKGRIKEAEDDYAAQQYWTISESLKAQGFEHYEVSNFSKPGFLSKHNTSYWKGASYLGIGPGAHSYNGESREYNISNNPKYISKLMKGMVPSTFEKLTNNDQINEYLITRLRTIWGIDLKYLKEKYNFDLDGSRKKIIDQFFDRDMIFLKDNHLILNEKGFLMADYIALELSL